MAEPRPIRVLIADDHSIVRDGLSAVIGREADMTVVAAARSWPEAVDLACRTLPDVAVLDLHMPGLEASAGIARLREGCPAVRLVVFSAFATDEDVHEALRAGALGFVPKGDSGREDLLACIRAAAGGEAWIHPIAARRLAERLAAPSLTPRETEVLRLVAEGKSNKEIGSALDVAEGTVKVHVNHILGKLGVAGRVEAILVAARRGLVRVADASPARPGQTAEPPRPPAPSGSTPRPDPEE